MLMISIAGIVVILTGFIIQIKSRLNCSKDDIKKSFRIGNGMVGVGMILILFGNAFAIIPTGYTGVRSTFGQISAEPVQNGFTWKIPFVQSIENVNNKQQDVTFENKIWSETSARTSVYYKSITVTYQIESNKSAWIYANITNYKDTLLTQGIVASGIKAASKTLSDEEATSRTKIEPLTAEYIQNAVDEKYGKGVVTIDKIVIGNADFEDSYNEAIAKKQKAQLEAEEQEIINKKNISEAEAKAEVKIKTAEAEAKANKILEKSLTDQVIKSRYIEKWDGKMPSAVASDDGNIFVGIGE